MQKAFVTAVAGATNQETATLRLECKILTFPQNVRKTDH